MRRVAVSVAVLGVLAGAGGGCTEVHGAAPAEASPVGAGRSPAGPVQPPAAATQPSAVPGPSSGTLSGYQVLTGDGFSVAIPEGWTDIPEDRRGSPDAAVEVAVPFTGQPKVPPSIAVWVDRGDNRGSAEFQAQVARGFVEVSALKELSIGDLREAQVDGAVDAMWFEYTFRQAASRSVLDTEFVESDYRIRELHVQPRGKPRFVLRYTAAASEFDEAVWDTALTTLKVQADAA